MTLCWTTLVRRTPIRSTTTAWPGATTAPGASSPNVWNVSSTLCNGNRIPVYTGLEGRKLGRSDS